MNMTYRLVTKLFLIMALLTISPMAMALEQETEFFEETVSCPSEDVYIAGTVRFQWHYIEGAENNTWIFQAFWRGDGVGLASGAKYILRGKWMEVVQGNPTFIMLANDHFQIISKGAAENYDTFWKAKFVVNANGDVIIDEDDFDFTCD